MEFEQFAATLPRERTVEFTSPEELEEALRQYGIEQPTHQLRAGHFKARLATSTTNHAELFSDRYSTAVSMQLKAPENAVGIMFPRSASGHLVANGEDVGNDKLLFFPAGCSANISGPPLIGSEAIVMPETQFVELTGVLCPAADRPEVMSIFDGDPVLLHSLRTAVRELVAQPESDVHDEDVANVVAETIAWIGDSCCLCESDHFAVSKARTRVARLAHAYIDDHYSDAVHMADLCRVTRVGCRTVQRSFREYFHVTVSDYLRTIRLDAARRQLAAARREETSVTRVAMDSGYEHLGRFSIDFHRRFGELPRNVLEKTPGLTRH